MGENKSVGVGTAIAAIIAPNAALAAEITVAPLANAAPTLSGVALIALAVLLASIAIARLRSRSIRVVTAIVLTLLLSQISHAGFSFFPIAGDECNQRTTKQFATNEFLHLVSHCSHPIQIVALDASCMGTLEGRAMADVDRCQVGDIIQPSQTCVLPNCL